MNYQPKGSMCMSCLHAKRDCSGLDFKQMRQIEKYQDRVVVKCSGFVHQPFTAELLEKVKP